MYDSDKKSPLERLKKSLYSRRQNLDEITRHDIHESEPSVPESWNAPASDAEGSDAPPELPASHRKAYRSAFIFAAGFFCLAVLVGAYTFLGGRNFVSVDNIDILIEGPTSISGGEELSLNVSVVNKNSTDLELVDLIVEYPEGSKDPLAAEKDLGRVRFSIGNIKSQSIAKKTIASLLFGEEGEEKQIKFTAEYRTAGSNAIFYKEKTYRVTISSSPILVSIDAFDRVSGSQPLDVKITVTSNTKSSLKNLLLSLDYPYGFQVVSSSPVPAYGNNVWKLGDLAPGAKKTITLNATAEGQDSEVRALRANVGIQSQSNERQIGTKIISRTHTFTLERPFLGLDITLNGDRFDLATLAGKSVRSEIIWMNNGQTKIINARIEAKFSGNVLDKNSVSVSDGGYYDSSTNTIIWEAGRTAGLDSIAPGDDGRVSFSFQSSLSDTNKVNPIITVSVTATGGRIDESGASADISSSISRSVKLVSNLALTSRSTRTGGPFSNTGPIPPKVEEATTYTAVWTVTNTSNPVSAVQVTAKLPAYVTWTGKFSPEDAKISYNPTGGTITWQAGEVPRNADIGTGAKQVSFQLSLLPSVGQAGEAPEILSVAVIQGIDIFTGANIQNNAPSLSTRTSTDLLWKLGNEIVQP